ncbi:MAG: hypothetical protein ACI4S4_03105 [Candidatus Ornithospirochaeta sp.]
MKKLLLVFAISLVMLSSCVISIPVEVEVSLFSDTPWEEATGKEMWYRLSWFDGKECHTEYLESGVWRSRIRVHSGALAIFVFYPLGTLEPFGGFWEGEGGEVFLTPEDGFLADTLLRAAEDYPDAVATLSIRNLRSKVHDLGSVDRVSIVKAVAEGKLGENEICQYKRHQVPLDGVMKGKWVSLYSSSSSIVVTDIVDVRTVSLFPGIYRYLSVERNLMLTIVVEEDGKYSLSVSPPPKW